MTARRRRSTGAPPTGPFTIDSGTASFDRVPGDPDAFVLTVNGVPSSPYCAHDPLRLDFEYMQWLAAGIDAALGGPGALRSLRALHVGGAACALPRRVAASRPGSRQTVVEIDAALVDWARKNLDLPRSPAIAIRSADGADEIARFRDETLDLVVRDAFAVSTIPETLQDGRWFGHVRRVLSTGGLYAANVADDPGRHALRAEVRGLRREFADICAITGGGPLRRRTQGNIVILASHEPLSHDAIVRHARAEGSAVPRVFGPAELSAACGLGV